MLNVQVRLLKKQANYQTSTSKIFTTILAVILSLVLSFIASSCFAKIHVSDLEYQPNSQLGTNPGGVFFDKYKDRKYYVKFYPYEMQARSEFLADKIYAIFGVNTPKAYIRVMKAPESRKEKLAYISRWDDDLEQICNKDEDCTKRIRDAREQLAKIHLISALVKNDDLGRTNILFKDNKVFVVDAGISFRFGHKGHKGIKHPEICKREYNPEANEFCSIVDAQKQNTAVIFSSPFKKYTMKNTDYLISWLDKHWDENEIKAVIKASGIDDGEMIFTNLKLRFEHLKTLLRELKENNNLCQ